MSSAQKTLRIICIVLTVLAIIGIVLGLLGMATGGLIGAVSVSNEGAAELAAQGYSSDAGLGAGILVGGASLAILISGIIDLIIAILGLRGAKDPSKIGPFRVFCIIGIVLCVLGVLACFTGSVDASTAISNVISLALVIWCFVLTNKIKAQS